MPVRKVSNRGGNIIGKFPSIKMERMIAFESLLERDFIYLLDYDPEVEGFEEQPLSIEYEYEGKKRRYTPDFHLSKRGQDILIECKPEQYINSEENQRKVEVARNWCRAQGWIFQVMTDQDIRGGFRLQNVKMLTRYGRQNVCPVIRGRIYALMSDRQDQTTIASLVRANFPGDEGTATATILHMAFHHQLWVSIDDTLLCGETVISLPLQARREGEV